MVLRDHSVTSIIPPLEQQRIGTRTTPQEHKRASFLKLHLGPFPKLQLIPFHPLRDKKLKLKCNSTKQNICTSAQLACCGGLLVALAHVVNVEGTPRGIRMRMIMRVIQTGPHQHFPICRQMLCINLRLDWRLPRFAVAVPAPLQHCIGGRLRSAHMLLLILTRPTLPNSERLHWHGTRHNPVGLLGGWV